MIVDTYQRTQETKMTGDTVALMMLSSAFSVQSIYSLLCRQLFHSSGFSSSFPLGREVTLPTITAECKLVTQGESAEAQAGWHPNWQDKYVVISREMGC